MMDARIASASALLTGAKLLDGAGDGIIRPPAIVRLLGVPLDHRGAMLQWLEKRKLYIKPPTKGPLVHQPLAGAVDLSTLRSALLSDLQLGPLPFEAQHVIAWLKTTPGGAAR